MLIGGLMKKAMVVMFVLLVTQLATAAEFKFVFKFPYGAAKPIETLVIKQDGSDYEQAYRAAASKCAKYFGGKTTLTEEKILDIIDVCANPR